MDIRSFEHGDRSFRYTDHRINLPKAATQQMLGMLHEWSRVFPPEHTYPQRVFGVPSLYIRFDGVWSDNVFHTYELESACGWIGYAGMANPAFHAIFDDLRRNAWPPFKLLIHDGHGTHDDELWIEKIALSDALSTSDALQIRYPIVALDERQRRLLSMRSIKPIRYQKNKDYGLRLGWWSLAGWEESEHGDALPWHEPFALKPTSGYGSDDVLFWTPDSRKGRSTQTQILRTLQQRRRMCIQPLYAPDILDINGIPHHIIHRPFFGYDPRKKDWVPMHGVWTGRPAPHLRIHGSSDAISGPLLLES